MSAAWHLELWDICPWTMPIVAICEGRRVQVGANYLQVASLAAERRRFRR